MKAIMHNSRLALKVFAVVACAGMTLMSCAVQADAGLAVDKSVALNLRMSMNPILVAYISDLNAALGASGNGGVTGSIASIVDLNALKTRLAKEPGVTVLGVDPVEGGGISVRLNIKDLQQVFASKGKDLANVFVLTPQSDKTKLSLNLDRKAVEVILGYAGNREGDLAALLPQDAKVDAKAYQGQLSWALSDYGSRTELDRMFKESVISLQLTVPRPVQSAVGFVVADKARGRVQLNIPVLEVLTLQKAVRAEVVF